MLIARIILAALLFAILPLVSAQAQTGGIVDDGQEINALKQLYLSTGGSKWTNRTNWLVGTTLTDAANWYGITVNNGDVVSIVLSNNHLVGGLPAELGDLKRLQTLKLDQDSLTGIIPQQWSSLTNLRYLWLNRNKLSGTLPPQFSQLSNLLDIRLDENRLSGDIPATYGQLWQLQVLSLSSNGFSGALPQQLGRLTNLTSLVVTGNALSGDLPDSLSRLQKLVTLSVNQNHFSGSVPNGYAQLPKLRSLSLQDNDLTYLPSFLAAPQVAGAGAAGLTINCSRNLLTFADIERNLTGGALPTTFSFTYSSQKQPGPAEVVARPKGALATLSPPVSGAKVHCQWERRIGLLWTNVNTTALPDTFPTCQLTFTDVSVEGEYRLKMTNRWAPTAVIYSKSFQLTLLPYAALPENLPQSSNAPPLFSSLIPNSQGTVSTAPINFVRTWVPRVALADTALVRRAGVDSVSLSTQYLDGLGRPIQTVGRAASPMRRDVVQVIEYDGAGRQPRDYLSYSIQPQNNEPSGAYRPDALYEQGQFYANPSGAAFDAPRTANPYVERGFEASPLERILAKGDPGEAWHLSVNHGLTFEERPNLLSDSVQRWLPGYDSNREALTYQGAYAAGDLWVKIARDEHQRQTRTFTDKQGRVVLEQAEVNSAETAPGSGQWQYSWLSTYHIYDDFGRERAVLPPTAVQRIRQANWNIATAGVEQLLTRTHYDERGRPYEQRRPDAATGASGYTYTVFDGQDRPIMTQHPAQRSRSEWTVTKYDALGRVVVTALTYRPGVSRSTLQSQANAATAFWEEPSSQAGIGNSFYTNQAFPVFVASSTQLLSVTYYDDYDFNHDGTRDADYDAVDNARFTVAPVPDDRTRGQVTRTRTRILPATSANANTGWITTTTIFDERARPIQVVTSRPQGTGTFTQRQTTQYNFSGEPLQTVTTVSAPTHPDQVITERRTFDHAGRLKRLTQQADGSAEVVIAQQRYNELGQLRSKTVGATPADTSGLQTLDYRYNSRGWLTHLNGLPLTGDLNSDSVASSLYDPRDLFSLRLSYERGFTDRQYNGNISGQVWRGADGKMRTYGYRYDPSGRLLQADFGAYNPASFTFVDEHNNWRFWAASYDANGNLLTMRRCGQIAAGTRTQPAQFAEIDNLRYYYQSGSNRLLHVDDLATPVAVNTPTSVRPDLQDRLTSATSAAELNYDNAGSATRVAVEGLNALTYNHLLLNQKVTFTSGDSLVYQWAADGQKLGAVRYTAGVPKQRWAYVGGFVYEQDSLRYWRTSEGRALYQQLNATKPVVYEYQIADHLGNVRVSFRPGERQSNLATLAQNQRQREIHQFDSASIDRARFAVLTSYANDGYVARLNAGGNTPVPVGPTKTLAVQKGDTIHAEAFFNYNPAVTGTAGFQFNLLSLVASWLTQQNASPDQMRLAPSVPWLAVALGQPLSNGLWGTNVPHAYLRVVAFDKDSQVVVEQVVPMTAQSANHWEPYQANLIAPKDGYVLVYVANDSDRPVDVDDVLVRYQPGLQVQEQHYDPFGLELVGLSRRGLVPTNRYLFNGKEAQAELGLNWTDHGARMYDPSLGRWHTVDPLYMKQQPFSTYSFCFNNPLMYKDPDGKSGQATINKDSHTITVTAAMIFYGSGNQTMAERVASDVQNQWNSAKGTVVIDGEVYDVVFNVSGYFDGDISVSEINKNTDIRNNFIKFDVTPPMDQSSMQQNSGFMRPKDVGTTTGSHEMGHGWGGKKYWGYSLSKPGGHPANSPGSKDEGEYRGKGRPGIMWPKNSVVDPQYAKDPNASPETSQGKMDPSKRQVNQDDIDFLGLDKLNFDQNGKANLGSMSNVMH